MRRDDTANDTGIRTSMKLEYDMTVASVAALLYKIMFPCLSAYLTYLPTYGAMLHPPEAFLCSSSPFCLFFPPIVPVDVTTIPYR